MTCPGRGPTLKRTAAALGRFHGRNLDYFSLFGERVARTNLRQLRTASILLALFLLCYGLLTYLMFRSTALLWCYLGAGAAELFFLPFAFLYGRREATSFRVVQGVCALFILAVLGFTVALSVFPFPENPGIFYPLAYMLMTVLFVLPYHQTALLLTGTTVVYLLLTVWFKSPAAVRYDCFAAVTTWALGFFFLYVVTDLRLRDGERVRELEELSRTDPLTGLPNRLYLEEHLEVSYRRCQRAGMWCAFIMLDVDDFKSYNDVMGHQAGDDCLRALGRVLLDFSEEQGVYAARYGGEEFLLFLLGCSEEDAQWAAADLLSRVRALDLPFPGRGKVSVSLGVAVELPGPESSWSDLLRRADEALYRSKAGGKDRMELWDTSPV